MKSFNQMDLEEEWELLPDEGFLEIHDDGVPVREIKIMTPPQPQQRVSETIIKPVDTSSDDHNNQESFSQVFFNKLMKETDHHQFVDMKVESPKFNNNSNRGTIQNPSQIEGAFDHQFEEKIKTSGKEDKSNNDDVELNDEGGMNIWKRSLTGIGAICSFGVAAATICIVIFGSHNKKQNQKLPFQIYNNDRRIKQVFRHASKLNEAITGLRGSVPITRAHVTVGGYYDAAI